MSLDRLLVQLCWENSDSPFGFVVVQTNASKCTLADVRRCIEDQQVIRQEESQYSFCLKGIAVSAGQEEFLHLDEILCEDGSIALSERKGYFLGADSKVKFSDVGFISELNFNRMPSLDVNGFAQLEKKFSEREGYHVHENQAIPLNLNASFDVDLKHNRKESYRLHHLSHYDENAAKGVNTKHALPPVSAGFLESDFLEGLDDEFVSNLETIIDDDPSEKMKISVMEPNGRFVLCEDSKELFKILDFCKYEEMKLNSPNSASKSSEHVMWINFEGGKENTIFDVGDRLSVHPLTIEDCIHKDVRQKLEPFDNYIFIVLESLHHLDVVDDDDKENVLKILVFANLVVTFHRYPLFAINTARSRLRKLHSANPKRIESMDILHAILDSVADTDVPIVNSIEEETRNLENLFLNFNHIERSDFLLRIGMNRKKNIRYRQMLWPKRDILFNLVHREYVNSMRREMTVAYFRDVYDHVVMMISKLQISTEFVASLESTYLAKVSIEMADTSNQFNEVMKKLSLTATILLPLTFLTGLFGMNIQVPWQTPGDGTGTLDAFYGIIGFMLFFSTACSIAFKLMFKD